VPKKMSKILTQLQNLNSPKTKKLAKPTKPVEVTHNNGELPVKVTTAKQPVKLPVVSQDSGIPSSSQNDAVLMFKAVKRVLENNFKNVIERLQLHSLPSPCLFDLRSCQQNHSKAAPVCFISDSNQYLLNVHVENDNYFQFIQLAKNRCAQGEFPGSDLLHSILLGILVSFINFTLLAQSLIILFLF